MNNALDTEQNPIIYRTADGRSALGVDDEGYGLKIYPPVNAVNK